MLLPDLEAGCSLSDSCPAPEFERFVRAHPGHTVISYINCSAAVKALSDIICTSSNAERIVRSVPEGTPIIFAPDQQLGRYVITQTGRDMVLWPGSCSVHVIFSERQIVRLKVEHPDALVIAHPECEARVLAHADYIGSTTALLNYTKSSPARRFIVATESGHPAPDEEGEPGQGVHPGAAGQRLRVQRVPLHAAEHAREGVSLHARPAACRDAARAAARARAKVPLDRMLALSRG